MAGGGGHHGGAWKVAYADFVTAMMAFFLMLWLLGSVTEEKRQGIADYFSDTHAIRSDSAGGSSVFGGVSLSMEDSITDDIATKEEFRSQTLSLETVMDTIKSLAMQDETFASAFEHLIIRMTEDGLIIELFDLEHRSLFEDGTDQPKPVLEFLIEAIANAFQTVLNPVAIDAHSRSFPSVFLENPVWPASLDRARKVHQMMELSGLSTSRFQRVTGHADRTLVDPIPTAMRNNRIELTLLRKSGVPASLGGN